LSASHVIYGLRIRSNLPLPGLLTESRPGREEFFDLKIRLKEHPNFLPSLFISSCDFFYSSPNPETNGDPSLRVGILAGGKYYGFFYADGARFAVNREGNEIWADWPENYTLEDACTYLIGPVLAFALRLRGGTCLHASAIAIGDQAIALLGVPGAGKSTTAAAFARLGYPVLSDDVAVLDDRVDHFLVQPGYPRINLWQDSVQALFGSEDALPRITPTWDKRYFALDRNGHRFQSEPLPLGTIYVLKEREPGLTTSVVEELNASEAFMALVANTYVNYLLDAGMRSREFEVLGRVVARIPVRRVRPLSDPSRLFDLCATIAANASQIVVSGRQSE
jgi:hypothetical protein